MLGLHGMMATIICVIMKKSILLLSALLTMSVMPFQMMADDGFVRGDTNLDGRVNISDVTALINFLLSGRWSDDPQYPELPETINYSVNGVPFKMVLVEGGNFYMGATSDQGSDAVGARPAHRVTLDSYYICSTETTQALWLEVMGVNPSRYIGDDNLPVEMVSWDDVQIFLTELNAITGKHFRLPTEAEWEYAARGGNKSMGYMYAGSNNVGEVAWYVSNAGTKTHVVASKKANELGLYDMSGNVWEWCQDWYSEYSGVIETNPTGPETGTSKVMRSGAFSRPVDMGTAEYHVRVSYRHSQSPATRYRTIGFRLAISTDEI